MLSIRVNISETKFCTSVYHKANKKIAANASILIREWLEACSIYDKAGFVLDCHISLEKEGEILATKYRRIHCKQKGHNNILLNMT